MDATSLIPSLLDIAKKVHHEELTFLNHLSPAEQNARGSLQKWAPKDELNHLNYWKRRAIERLSYFSRGMPAPAYPGYLECNDSNFNEYKDTSLPFILRESDNILKSLAAVMERFAPEEVIEKGKLTPKDANASLLSFILDNFVSHPLNHIALQYHVRGETEKGNGLMNQALEHYARFSDDAYVQAMGNYYATDYFVNSGQNSSAIELLRQAIVLYPDIKAELADSYPSLNEDPAFQDLIK
ncbi:MAG TPA: hypothetical protein PKD55_12290 [Bellilinea sp.]|nr:hypothetical protein [Bellilinea sp.]